MHLCINQIQDKATELEANEEHEPRHQMRHEGLLEDNTGPLTVNAQVHHTANSSTATCNAATTNVSTTTPNATVLDASTTTADAVATTATDVVGTAGVVNASTSNALLGSGTSSLSRKNILFGLFSPLN